MAWGWRKKKKRITSGREGEKLREEKKKKMKKKTVGCLVLLDRVKKKYKSVNVLLYELKINQYVNKIRRGK